MPKIIAAELKKWAEVYVSPKSNSYYNVPYEKMKTHGAMRISDHWNYGPNAATFRTNIGVRGGHWAACEYNGREWVVKIYASPIKNMVTVDNSMLPIANKEKTQ